MEMTCVCGEVLKGKKSSLGDYLVGSVAEEYAEHMKREDHKASPSQWATAHEKIAEQKERAKSRQ